MGNYLVFHSVTEMFSVVVAGRVFAVTWHTQVHRPKESGFFLVIGIGSLSVAALDLVHTLAFKGMNVFPGYDANLPTQLWIASRYLQSLSLFAASSLLFLRKSGGAELAARARYVALASYAVVTALLLLSVFSRFFPTCWVEGSGLTPFKRVSEYAICAILAGAAILLWHSRARMDRDMLRYFLVAIGVSILCELAFTLYTDVYDLFNMAGHILKTIVFLALYRAMVLVGIRKPYTLLSQGLQESEKRYRMIVENSSDALFIQDLKGDISDVNQNSCRMLGYSRDELVGSNMAAIAGPGRSVPARLAALEDHDTLLFESEVLRRDGSALPVEVSVTVVSREGGGTIQSFVRDISERKCAEAAVQKAFLENRILLGELQHRVKNSFAMITGMIGLTSDSVASTETRTALQELGTRVHSVSELYSLLNSTKSFNEVRLDDYCARVAAPLVSLAGNVALETRMESVTVPVGNAAPIGLILTELVTNAAKYAFPGGRRGTIAVSLGKTGSGLILEVRDDGAGLPAGFDLAADAGMGLSLVQALASQIDGAFRMEGSAAGTICVLEFPDEVTA
jgi:PAS domain S-box-containing protein